MRVAWVILLSGCVATRVSQVRNAHLVLSPFGLHLALEECARLDEAVVTMNGRPLEQIVPGGPGNTRDLVRLGRFPEVFACMGGVWRGALGPDEAMDLRISDSSGTISWSARSDFFDRRRLVIRRKSGEEIPRGSVLSWAPEGETFDVEWSHPTDTLLGSELWVGGRPMREAITFQGNRAQLRLSGPRALVHVTVEFVPWMRCEGPGQPVCKSLPLHCFDCSRERGSWSVNHELMESTAPAAE